MPSNKGRRLHLTCSRFPVCKNSLRGRNVEDVTECLVPMAWRKCHFLWWPRQRRQTVWLVMRLPGYIVHTSRFTRYLTYEIYIRRNFLLHAASPDIRGAFAYSEKRRKRKYKLLNYRKKVSIANTLNTIVHQEWWGSFLRWPCSIYLLQLTSRNIYSPLS